MSAKPIIVDQSIISGSINPVSGGAVFNGLAGKQSQIDALSAYVRTKSTTRIYNTFAELVTLLSGGGNSTNFKNGDIFAFRDLTTDYIWTNGSLQPIVGQKTDLTNYLTNDDIVIELQNYYLSKHINTTELGLNVIKEGGRYDIILDVPHSIIGVSKFNLKVDLTDRTPIQTATYTNSSDYSIHKFERGST